jgi:hypothetical protein
MPAIAWTIATSVVTVVTERIFAMYAFGVWSAKIRVSSARIAAWPVSSLPSNGSRRA